MFPLKKNGLNHSSRVRFTSRNMHATKKKGYIPVSPCFEVYIWVRQLSTHILTIPHCYVVACLLRKVVRPIIPVLRWSMKSPVDCSLSRPLPLGINVSSGIISFSYFPRLDDLSGALFGKSP